MLPSKGKMAYEQIYFPLLLKYTEVFIMILLQFNALAIQREYIVTFMAGISNIQ